MERALITGGAGYLGNKISRVLLEEGYAVTCLDNLMYHQGDSVFPLANHPNYTFVFGDARDTTVLDDLTTTHDILIPLAAIVGEAACKRRPQEARQVNLEAVAYMNHVQSPHQKMICPITNSGYGTQSGTEFCTEETPLEPISLYGQTKVESEKILLDSGKDVITLRLATVFGTSERMRRDLMVNDFVYKAVTDKSIVLFEPHFKRNFVHISDVAQAFSFCLRHYDTLKNEAYNLGIDSANMSKLELAQKVQEQVPDFEVFISEHGQDPDKRNYIVSNQKLRAAGFEATTTIETGIAELIKGYDILLKNIPYTNL